MAREIMQSVEKSQFWGWMVNKQAWGRNYLPSCTTCGDFFLPVKAWLKYKKDHILPSVMVDSLWGNCMCCKKQMHFPSCSNTTANTLVQQQYGGTKLEQALTTHYVCPWGLPEFSWTHFPRNEGPDQGWEKDFTLSVLNLLLGSQHWSILTMWEGGRGALIHFLHTMPNFIHFYHVPTYVAVRQTVWSNVVVVPIQI